MAITGWNSYAIVRIEILHCNNHVSFYRCKAKDLAFLLHTLEEHKNKIDHNNFKNYSVYYKNNPVQKDFFGFTESYSNWVMPII